MREFSGQTEVEVNANFNKVMFEEISKLAIRIGYTRDDLYSLFTSAYTADTICDLRETYHNENIDKLASLEPTVSPIWKDTDTVVVELILRGAQAPIRLSAR